MPAKDYHGWRNTWDQDEVMVCPPIAEKIECSHGYFCKGTIIHELVGRNGQTNTYAVKDEDKGGNHRYDFFMIPKSKEEASAHWSIDRFAAEDQAYAIFDEACRFADNLDEFIAEKAINDKEAEEKLKAKPAIPFLPGRIKTKITAAYSKSKGLSGQTWQNVLDAYAADEITWQQIQTWRT